ncbi:MAG: peptidoglycan editing factor PgeF [Pseudomonadota bacterium]
MTESEPAGALEALTSPTLKTRHAFFTRQGGVSTGIYASLQCGPGAKGDPEANVAENRRRAAAALGVAPERLVSLYQAHTDKALAVTAPFSRADAPEADGMATAVPGIALGVLTADCAPVLLEDREAGVIGACHAGWKGALAGILEATLEAMAGLGAERTRIVAAVGPCIGPKAYEVGPEYEARFVEADASNARFFRPGADDRRLFDLPAYVVARLSQAGVAMSSALNRCTYAEEPAFFSNRRAVHRDEEDYGRLLSAIVL